MKLLLLIAASAIVHGGAFRSPALHRARASPARRQGVSMVLSEGVQAAAASATVYGPQAPDASVLAGLAGTVLLSGGAYVYWDKVIVPMKRTEVSKSKRKGEIKEYLEEIREDDDRKAEQWLFNDWLEPAAKEAAIPGLPKAKWNSGDNPVIAAAALITLLGVGNAVVEKVAALL